LEVSGAVGPLYGSLGVKRLNDIKGVESDVHERLYKPLTSPPMRHRVPSHFNWTPP